MRSSWRSRPGWSDRASAPPECLPGPSSRHGSWMAARALSSWQIFWRGTRSPPRTEAREARSTRSRPFGTRPPAGCRRSRADFAAGRRLPRTGGRLRTRSGGWCTCCFRAAGRNACPEKSTLRRLAAAIQRTVIPREAPRDPDACWMHLRRPRNLLARPGSPRRARTARAVPARARCLVGTAGTASSRQWAKHKRGRANSSVGAGDPARAEIPQAPCSE
jgi:hypothetical protein